MKKKKYLELIRKNRYWRLFIYVALAFLLIHLIIDVYSAGFEAATFTRILGRILGIFFLIVLLKYAPVFAAEMDQKKRLEQLAINRIFRMSAASWLLFIFGIVIAVILALAHAEPFVIIITLFSSWLTACILYNAANFYFWRKTRSNLFVIVPLIVVVLALISSVVFILMRVLQPFEAFESALLWMIVFTVPLVILAVMFFVGGLIYNMYMMMRYIVPHTKPHGSKKTWVQIYKDAKKEKPRKTA